MKKRLVALLLTVCLVAAVSVIPVMAHGHHHVTHRPVTNSRPIFVSTNKDPSVFVGPFSRTLPFTDVQITDWFVDAVRFVYHEDMMKGVSVTEFKPNEGLTRAMAAQILYNMASNPGAAPAEFSDVAPTDWYEDAIGWAASLDIVTGYEDGTFRPNELVTREQIVAMLHRYAGYREVDRVYMAKLEKYEDCKDIGAWAFASMQWAAAAELLNEETDVLRPKDTATRAEVAQLLWNYCKATADSTLFFTPSSHFAKPWFK